MSHWPMHTLSYWNSFLINLALYPWFSPVMSYVIQKSFLIFRKTLRILLDYCNLILLSIFCNRYYLFFVWVGLLV